MYAASQDEYFRKYKISCIIKKPHVLSNRHVMYASKFKGMRIDIWNNCAKGYETKPHSLYGEIIISIKICIHIFYVVYR